MSNSFVARKTKEKELAKRLIGYYSNEMTEDIPTEGEGWSMAGKEKTFKPLMQNRELSALLKSFS